MGCTIGLLLSPFTPLGDLVMQVIVYTTPTCPQCEMTKKVLTKGNVSFEVVDLSTNSEAMAYVKEELGYTAAPVVVAGTQHWSGFRLGALDTLTKAIHSEDSKVREMFRQPIAA
jgi:glutaredoxin-like protein NrdH